MGISRLQDPSLIKPTSNFLLGDARESLESFYSEEELAKFHDTKCTIEVIQRFVNEKETPLFTYYTSQSIDQTINGALVTQIYPHQKEKMIGLIDIIAVSEKRKGIGKNLVQKFEEEFSERVNFFAAWIKKENGPSQALFTKLGYHQDGVHPQNPTTLGFYKDL